MAQVPKLNLGLQPSRPTGQAVEEAPVAAAEQDAQSENPATEQRFTVLRDAKFVQRGIPMTLRGGKVVSSFGYPIDEMRRQGIPLGPVV